MTRREAERLRDQVVARVNDQVFTFQSQIRLDDFVKIYDNRPITLPEFGKVPLCEIGNDHAV